MINIYNPNLIDSFLKNRELLGRKHIYIYDNRLFLNEEI